MIKPFAILDPACPEAQWWVAIVGTLDVPLKSPIPEVLKGPHELETPHECYLVDVDRLTDKQVEGICGVMAAKFDVPIDEVRAGIRMERGLPIRANRVRLIAFDGRFAL